MSYQEYQQKLHPKGRNTRLFGILVIGVLLFGGLAFLGPCIPQRGPISNQSEPHLVVDVRQLLSDQVFEFLDQAESGSEAIPNFKFVELSEANGLGDMVDPIKRGDLLIFYSTRHEDWFDEHGEPIVVMNMVVYIKQLELLVYFAQGETPTQMNEGLFLMLMDRLGWVKYEPFGARTQPSTSLEESR